MRVEHFDFQLPEELIALRPARPRDAARLLAAPASGDFEDRLVRDAPALFRAGDVLVFNDARVIRARLRGMRDRGGAVVPVEATLHQRLGPARWSAFARPGKRLRAGDDVRFGPEEDRACAAAGLAAHIAEMREEGEIVLEFALAGVELDLAIERLGAMPLPPYIASRRAEDDEDVRDYQTVYAKTDGAVAAPTAGLHFTDALLAALDARGVERRFVTLDVGAGTFLPVKADDTQDHRMHSERRRIERETADAVNRAREEGRRIVAVGTTALRTLESSVNGMGRVRPVDAPTDLFITPGFRFRVVDALWTNFHLPRSTLFMLVAAFAGLERAHAAYAHAIEAQYRFYSYGDACLFQRGAA